MLSTPEPGLALVGMGKRDVAFDEGLPTLLQLRDPRTGKRYGVTGPTVTSLNDQHAFLDVPSGMELQVGQWLMFGISHPCTQFDKWHLIPVVDEDYVVKDFIRTFF